MRIEFAAARFLIVVGLSMAFCAPRSGAQVGETAVVVSASNSTVNLSLVDLRKIFSGTKHTWPGGQTIMLVTRGPGTPERLVLLRLLAMSEGEYKQYWTAQVFRGDADAEPLIVPSVGMQKEAMKIYPGAISLVNTADVKPGMKVIKIEGALPGAPGYPLH